MKFYVTIEGIQKLKRSFLNLKIFSIIHVPDILSSYNYNYDSIDTYGTFIVNNKINDLILSYTKSKRIRGIIYSNPNLSIELIPTLFDKLNTIDKITDVVLLDDYNVPKLEKIYSYFDEIIFFPAIKKIRLIECNPISIDNKWNKK